MELLKENNIEIEERDLTLVEFINADLVFATGTNGEITPVTEMEGREIKCDQDFLEKIKNLSRLSSLLFVSLCSFIVMVPQNYSKRDGNVK